MSYKGVYTAIVTPFTKDGNIDEEVLRQLVDFQISEGISGIVPMGTTGESPTLDHEEHIRAIEIVIDQANGKVPVIAGTGSNSTAEAIKMTKYAAEIGADASLQVAPYYNKPTQEGFYRHFAAIDSAVDIPLIIYNIQGRTGKNIENETMLKLAELSNIKGVKEASGDVDQVMDLILKKPDSFDVLSGDDNLAFLITALGGRGVISVASNIVPAQMVSMIRSCLDGRLAEARDLHYKLLPLFRALFIETNPIPVKYALSLQNKIEEIYRLPMCQMSKENRKAVKAVLKDLDLIGN